LKVFVTPEARADLRALRSARAEFSEDSAQELLFALLRRLRQIREFPGSGRMIPEFQLESLREILEQG
jgi:plasmid stabilization system protein ParE